MLYKLRCRHCGFKFVCEAPDNISPVEELELKTCVCGEVMEQDDTLEPYNTVLGEDVAEVRHGKWVNPPKRKENVGYRNGFGIYYECSRCGFIEDYHANFCPNCGADMRGE